MRKNALIFLIMIIVFLFCSCDTNHSMIGTKSGMVYFNESENISEIICSYYSETQEEKIKIDDATFVDKLRDAIGGKPAGNDFCDCMGDYKITIDNKYLFYLHSDRIVVYTDLEKHTFFTVLCSEQETKRLYDIIESAK